MTDSSSCPEAAEPVVRVRLTRQELERLAAERGTTCWLIEHPIEGESVSADHVVPVTYGGTNA